MKKLLLTIVCLLGMTCAAWSAPDATVKYEAADIGDMLTEYGKLTGKKVLCENLVQGRLAAVVSQSESTEREVELIEKALFLNGFSLIDAGNDVVEVLGLGKTVRNGSLPIYTKPEELPVGERVFTFLFKLEHRDPAELVAVFLQYLPPSTTISFTPDRGSRTLIATGPTSLIRTLIKQMPVFDVPSATAVKPTENSPRPPVRLLPTDG